MRRTDLRKLEGGELVVSWKSFVYFAAAMALVPMLSGCEAESARDQINNQYASDFQVKKQELQPMVGTFQGTVNVQGQAFDCTIMLNVPPESENSPQSEDPSETVPVARLQGSILFPELQKLPLEDYAGFQSFFHPLDDQAVVNVDFGDYNPDVYPPVTLPYLAQDGKTVFGSFDGEINGDQFTGTWFANRFGNVGTFSLTRISNVPSAQPQGGNP